MQYRRSLGSRRPSRLRWHHDRCDSPPTCCNASNAESRVGREFHPEPLTGRVEDWRAGLGRSLYSLFLALSFASVTLSRPCTFPAPATSNAACGFPALRSPVCFTSRLWDLSCWGDFRHSTANLVAVVQPQRFVQPSRIHASNRSPYGSGPAPYGADLLFTHLNEAEALAGVPTASRHQSNLGWIIK